MPLPGTDPVVNQAGFGFALVVSADIILSAAEPEIMHND